MAQAKARSNQDGQSLLNEVIHLIAANPDSEDTIRTILQMLQDEAGASGASFILFDEPQMIVVTGDGESWPGREDHLKDIISQLSDGLYVNTPLSTQIQPQSPGWVISPIHQQKPAIGSVWLFFSAKPELKDDTKTRLEALVASLKIIATNLRARALFKKLNRNQSEFMRIVSHDLRSPLTSMQGFASMLEAGMVGEMNEKQKHFVTKILSGITQMTALVDNIQDAGRYDPETGFYELNRSQCDLGEIVQKIVENHLVPAEKALHISVSVADNVPIINADANMLERAIINLYDNALKYTPDGGTIEVGVKRVADEITVMVSDTGLGISQDAQQHLFERHVRIAREEHKRIKGSGLGLFIVRSVAQRHGGDAWVESDEGTGSTFFLSIPLEGPNLVGTGV
jgi:signal transduction histidine kinase